MNTQNKNASRLYFPCVINLNGRSKELCVWFFRKIRSVQFYCLFETYKLLFSTQKNENRKIKKEHTRTQIIIFNREHCPRIVPKFFLRIKRKFLKYYRRNCYGYRLFKLLSAKFTFFSVFNSLLCSLSSTI